MTHLVAVIKHQYCRLMNASQYAKWCCEFECLESVISILCKFEMFGPEALPRPHKVKVQLCSTHEGFSVVGQKWSRS